MKRLVVLLMLLLLPSLVFGAVGVFDVSPNDKSISYLGEIFGTIPGTAIQAPNEGQGVAGSALISQVVYIFNQTVFLLGILIVVYTSVVGAVHTAQEGQFLGKSWHSVFVPLRAGIGVLILLPSYGGYNWIQIAVMWFIVQGIGAANALWKEVIVTNQSQGSIHTDTRQKNLSNQQISNAVNALFQGTLCMEMINNDAKAVADIGDYITVFQAADKIQFGRFKFIGEPAICGAINLPTNIGTDPATNEQIYATAMLSAQGALVAAAQDAMNHTPPAQPYEYADAFASAAGALVSAAQNIQVATQQNMQGYDTQFADAAIETGWIHAGSYYYQIVAGGGGFTLTPPQVTVIAPNLSMGALTKFAQPLTQKTADYIQYVNNAITPLTAAGRTGGTLQLQKQPIGGVGGSILGLIFGTVFDDALEAMETQMTTGGANGDPILSLASFGAGIAEAAEVTFWVAISLAIIFWLGGSVLQCSLPLANTLNYLMTIILSIAMILITMLWAPGIMLALYVPMIPYFVFTFTAIGWIILVIEAMFGASLIGLTFIVPSEDDIGKAGHALIILLGLFLRPPLMILGFIMGIQLLIVAMAMLNFGFFATLKAGTGGGVGLGLFGTVAVISLYAGIAIGMVHEAMSLIFVLPNKVLRWMGGAPEGEDVMGQVQEMKGAVKKGSETAGAGMKAGVKAGGKMQESAGKGQGIE